MAHQWSQVNILSMANGFYMGQSRPLFVYFRSFQMTNLAINNLIGNVLGIRTQGGRMVDEDKSTELWRHPKSIANVYTVNSTEKVKPKRALKWWIFSFCNNDQIFLHFLHFRVEMKLVTSSVTRKKLPNV